MPAAERVVRALQYARIGAWGLSSVLSAVGGALTQVEREVRILHDMDPPAPDPAIRSAAEVVAQHMRHTGESTINDYGPNLNDLPE
jgi:hypothetical protein